MPINGILMQTTQWMQIDGKWFGGGLNLEHFERSPCSPDSDPMTWNEHGKDSLRGETHEKWYFYWFVGCVYLAIDTNFSLFSAVMTSRVSLASPMKDDNYQLKANACWQLSWHNSKAVIVFITFSSSLGLSARLLNINYRRRLIIVSGGFLSPGESRKVKERVLWLRFGKALPSEKLKAQSIGSEPPCLRKSSETARWVTNMRDQLPKTLNYFLPSLDR